MRQDTDRLDALTVEDRFFLEIALKNRLIAPEQAERAVAEVRERGIRLEAALYALHLLDEAEIARVREAIAASQVVRLDSIYAQLAVAHGLVDHMAIDEAFAEQRRQRFRVRLGNLLLERGAIKAEDHRRIITQVIREVKRAASASSAAPVQDVPPSERVTRPLPTAAESSPERPAAGRSGYLLVNLGQLEAGPEEERSTAPRRQDRLVASVIRHDLDASDTDTGLRRTDAALLEDDLRRAGGTVSDFELDRPGLDAASRAASTSLSGTGAGLSRLRLVQLVCGAICLVVLIGVASVFQLLLANRGALAEAQRLVHDAEAAQLPARRRELFLAAGDALAAGGGLGVSGRDREELAARARWGVLEAEVLEELAAGRAAEAGAMLERRAGEVPEQLQPMLEELTRTVRRSDHLQHARQAEEAGDLPAAVQAYRAALSQGDPGGQARERLDALRSRLRRQVEEAYARAQASLDAEEERALSERAAGFQVLFREDLLPSGWEEDLQVRRLRRDVLQALGQGALEAAEVRLREGLRLRPHDPELTALRERLERRQQLTAARERARAASEAGDYPRAREAAEQVLALAEQEPDRAAARALLEDVERRQRDADIRADRRRRFEQAVGALREGRAEVAVPLLETLTAEDPGEPRLAALLALARRVTGMVFVPGGAFVMGSDPGAVVKPLEQPAHRVTLPPYFIDRTEVTNAAYARYVAEAGAPLPRHWTHRQIERDGTTRTTYDPELADHPVVQVTWAQARDYARWRGADLPSEAQWEKAARGADGRTWPWGNDAGRVEAHVNRPPDPHRPYPTAQVGVHRDDRSPCGAMDMAGNVNEWTQDLLRPYPGAPTSAVAPREPRRVLRGGAFRYPMTDARCSAREGAREDYASGEVGFRLVVEVPADLRAVLR